MNNNKNIKSKSFINAAIVKESKMCINWCFELNADEFDFYSKFFNNDGNFFGTDNESRALALLFCAAMTTK